MIPEGTGPSAAEADSLKSPDQIKTLVLCSGKVYYDLQRACATPPAPPCPPARR
eukprot:SAG11_NODE_208_length_12354_cov_19.490167_12_plen_54_part_00